jgi:hypothetical protein
MVTPNATGRLAFRDEGKFWVAYLAPLNTMVGATKIGTIRMRLVDANPAAKEAFMEAMKVAFNGLVQDTFGVSVERFDTQSAPEHEKSGHS